MFKPKRTVAPINSVLTLEEAKMMLSVSFSDDDLMIESMVADATEYLDGYGGILGRCIISQTWQQTFTAWQSEIRLPFPDCQSAIVEYVDGDDVLVELLADEFFLLEDSVSSYLRLSESFRWPALKSDHPNPITVTFNVGYGDEADDVPGNVKRAVALLAGHFYENREASGVAKDEIALGFAAMFFPSRRGLV